MSDRPDSRADTAALHRRRFLGTTGIVAGTAWVAPAVISATPAAAGAPSIDPCAPVVTDDSYDCATGGSFRVSVPQGCPPVPLLVEISTNGGTFTSFGCFGASSAVVNITGNESNSIVARISWVTDCTTTTVIHALSSITMGGCAPPGATPDDGAAPEITTRSDGDGITVTFDRP